MECLVDMDADVNIEENGHTPLYHAVCNGNDFIVNVLLKQVSNSHNVSYEQRHVISNNLT